MSDEPDGTSAIPPLEGTEGGHKADVTTAEVGPQEEAAATNHTLTSNEQTSSDSQNGSSMPRRRKPSEALREKLAERKKLSKENREAEVALTRKLQGALRREENERKRTQEILIGRWFLEVADSDPTTKAFIGRLIKRKLQTPKEYEALSGLYWNITGEDLQVPPGSPAEAREGQKKKSG